VTVADRTYRIPDEPKPSGLAHLAVNPVWPFFAHMFGGIWLAWPWFILNGIAVGSPTLVREILAVLGGGVVSVILGFAMLYLHGNEALPTLWVPYLAIGLTVVKLAFSYYLFALQGRTFELFLYFGGTLRNGLPVVILGALLTRRILGDSTLLLLILR
jgi:hypothetical protein